MSSEPREHSDLKAGRSSLGRVGVLKARLSRCLFVILVPLLASALAWSDFQQETQVAPGVKYIKIVKSNGPLQIDVLVVDLKNPGVKVESHHAGQSVLELEPLSHQMREVNEVDHYATAGINGDFFFRSPKEYAGKPIGLQVNRGEIISSPWRAGRSCFAILRDGQPVIDIPTMNAWANREDGSTFPVEAINAPRGPDALVLFTPAYGPSTQTPPFGLEVTISPVNLPLESGIEIQGKVAAVSGAGNSPIPYDGVVLSAEGTSVSLLESLRSGQNLSLTAQLSPPFDQALEAIGGGPRLIRNGRISVEGGKEGFEANLIDSRHPRSAIGFDDSRLFLLTIDGRQQGYSVGATLEETAQLLKSLGATEAMNLDGGGSSTLIAQGKILNSPSDGVERRIANGLLTVCTIPKGPPETLTINPPVLHIASGSSFTFAVEAKDHLGNVVPPGPITWVLNPADLGSLSQDGRLLAGRASGSGLVKAFSQGSTAHAYAEVIIHEAIASVSLQPSSALLFPDEPLRLRFAAYSENGEEVAVDPASVYWTIESGSGQVDSQGTFVSSSPGVVEVAAFFKGLKATARLYVGGAVVKVEDFEDISEWSPSSYPAGVPASFRKSSRYTYSGAYSGRLLYDFATVEVTRAAYVTTDLPIGKPRILSVWVYGDGSGHWLRGALKDGSGQRLIVDFARRVDWKDEWRQVSASLPEAGFTFPLRLLSIYLAEPDPEKRDEGMIYLDDLRALY